MPKQKTHKGLKKRFKITAKGKAKHRCAGRGHILGKKSADRKRRLRQGGLVLGKDAEHRKHEQGSNDGTHGDLQSNAGVTESEECGGNGAKRAA